MVLIIPRSDIKSKIPGRGWILLYGRRKTGKTFFVNKMLGNVTHHYFVARDGTIFLLHENLRAISYDAFIEVLRTVLRDPSQFIVIDEFQRLPENFQDFLHAMHATSGARIVLVSSVRSLMEKILTKKTPLLGLLYPVEVRLPSGIIVLPLVCKNFPPRDAILISMFLREVSLTRFFPPPNIDDFIKNVIWFSRTFVPTLVGEIFQEEDLKLTKRYELILLAIASGEETPSGIASFISGRVEGTLRADDVKKYLYNLTRTGMVYRIPVFKKKKRYIYRIDSYLVDLFYFLQSKTGFAEIDVPESTLVSLAWQKMPIYFERFVVNMIAEMVNGQLYKSQDPEIDGIVKIPGEDIIGIEVKMGTAAMGDIRKFRGKLSTLNIDRGIILAEKIHSSPEDIAKVPFSLLCKPEELREIINQIMAR